MNTLERRAELGKSIIRGLRIREVGFYKDVDVLREARLRVKNDCVTSNNQISNAMGMEGGQKVFVVLVHPALFSSL
jgi:hypothetical protein